ncbi:MAG TPA: hypothetical protein VFU22_30235 [Roseiflexaceae bacterium]|nr:hypothetical protein [Roseiflexaceae bacterium]
MIGLSLVALALAALLVITIVRPQDTILHGVAAAYVFVAMAYLPLVAFAGLSLLFGVAEGPDGLFHLAFAVPLILAMYLIWRQPTWGSWLLIIAGLALYIETAVTPPQGNPDAINPAVAFVVPGILMLAAVGIAKFVKSNRLSRRLS